MAILSASSLSSTRRSELCVYSQSRYELTNSQPSAQDFETQGLCSNPIQFYDFLQNRVLIYFKPRDEEKDKEEFELVLSKKMNYEAVSQCALLPGYGSLNTLYSSHKKSERS